MNKTNIGLILAVGAILAIALFRIMSDNGKMKKPETAAAPVKAMPAPKKTMDLSQAQDYKILSHQDLSYSLRSRQKYVISADAATFDQRGQTAVAAALDFYRNDPADAIVVYLAARPEIPDIFCAKAEYCRDGKGWSGDKINCVWKGESSPVRLDMIDVQVAAAMKKLENSGMDKIDDMAKSVAGYLNISQNEVKTSWFKTMDLMYSQKPYEINGD